MLSTVISIFYSIANAINNLCHAICRDIKGILMVVHLESKLKKFDQNDLVLSDLFEKSVQLNPNKPCIIFNDKIWTFQEVV